MVSVRERVSPGNYRGICSNTQLSAEGVTCQLNISETGEFNIEVSPCERGVKINHMINPVGSDWPERESLHIRSDIDNQ